MLKLKKITNVYDMKVFADTGDYFGDVEEAVVTMTKIFGWRIRATRNSTLARVLGGAKGVIVPHRYVKAIGDIMIVSKTAIPEYGDAPMDEEGTAPEQRLMEEP